MASLLKPCFSWFLFVVMATRGHFFKLFLKTNFSWFLFVVMATRGHFF